MVDRLFADHQGSYRRLKNEPAVQAIHCKVGAAAAIDWAGRCSFLGSYSPQRVWRCVQTLSLCWSVSLSFSVSVAMAVPDSFIFCSAAVGCLCLCLSLCLSTSLMLAPPLLCSSALPRLPKEAKICQIFCKLLFALQYSAFACSLCP